MSASKIEWTDATWNPVTGCTEVSPGCAHCYAKRFAERFRGVPGHPFEHGFDLQLRPERLNEPLHWRKPRRVFVCSMADLFHEDVDDQFIADVLWTAAVRAPSHTYQFLTKRPERMLEWFTAYASTGMPLIRGAANLWLGTSIENDRFAYRANILRRVPSRGSLRFISAEPLLGPLPSLDLTGIDWLIIGGESGPGFRPMEAEWALDLIDRAHDAGVSVFVKQSSGLRHGMQGDLPDWAFALKEFPR
jgi:protein gp37